MSALRRSMKEVYKEDMDECVCEAEAEASKRRPSRAMLMEQWGDEVVG